MIFFAINPVKLNSLCTLALDAIRYKKALEFYADENNYNDIKGGGLVIGPMVYEVDNRGDIARAALAGDGGEEV